MSWSSRAIRARSSATATRAAASRSRSAACARVLGRLRLLGALADREAGEPADRELERDEDHLRGRVPGNHGDDDRRPDDRNAQPEARLERVPQVAEQERAAIPARKRLIGNVVTPPVDERDGHREHPVGGRGREREAPAQRRAARRAPRSRAGRTRAWWWARLSRAGPVRRRSRPSPPRRLPAISRSNQCLRVTSPIRITPVNVLHARAWPPPTWVRRPNRRTGRAPNAASRRRRRSAAVLASAIDPTGKDRLMEPPTTRLLQPDPNRRPGADRARAGGARLSPLRLRPGEVSVPQGAHAGQLALHPCTYATEQGGYAADCGTLVVPENRHDSHSRLIALPVKRIRALSAHPGEPVFRLQGGPGLTNMDFPDASRYAGDRDVVLVGYRGVDGSSVLDCPEVGLRDEARARPPRQRLLRRVRQGALRAARSGCSTTASTSPATRCPSVSTTSRPRGVALGYRRIDLLSESAGTRTALIYAWRLSDEHPPLGDGRRQPARATSSGTRDSTTSSSASTRRSARGTRPAAPGRTTSPPPSARPSRTIPGRWGFLRIKPGNARVGAFFGLMHSTDAAAPIAAPQTIDALARRVGGRRRAALWLLSTMSQLVFPEAQVKGDAAAVARTDAALRAALLRAHVAAATRSSAAPATDFLWAGGRLLDAWPANPDENEYSPGAGLERRDAADRRQPRLRDAAADRDAAAAAAPAERPPGRPARPRPHRRLLELPAAGELAPRQHVPRQRPGGRLALHAEPRRLRRRVPADDDGEDHPRRAARLRGADRASRCSCSALRVRRPRPARREDRAPRSARSTCSCSASAAGSSARWSR